VSDGDRVKVRVTLREKAVAAAETPDRIEVPPEDEGKTDLQVARLEPAEPPRPGGPGPAELPPTAPAGQDDTTDRSPERTSIDKKPPEPAVAPFTSVEAKEHQQAWADYLRLPLERNVELPDGEKLKLVLIPPGEFLMDSTPKERARFLEKAMAVKDDWAIPHISGEGPQHRVRITRPFYLGKYEVTQAQWQAVLGNNPAKFSDNPAHPVEQVSWDDTQPFLAKLNELASAEEMTFALPTEAQWEYACRAGTTTFWHSGDSEAALREHGWFETKSYGKTHPVGKLRPNGFGLHDMHGNVSEWCSDWYSADYYANSPEDDPSGPLTGSDHPIRGGVWHYVSLICRSAYRDVYDPGRRLSSLGFRLACEIPDMPESKPDDSGELFLSRSAPASVAHYEMWVIKDVESALRP
jgi:formylglycine-generating enzyme required for sulfatase activity